MGNSSDVQIMRARAVFFRLIGVLTFWLIKEGLELPVAPVSDGVAVKGFIPGELLLKHLLKRLILLRTRKRLGSRLTGITP